MKVYPDAINNNYTTFITGIVVLFGLFVLLIITTQPTYHATPYCDMVERWQEFQHLPPKKRPGWPDYKGTYDEECKQ